MFRLQFDEFQIVSSSHDDTILIWDFLNFTPPNEQHLSGSREYYSFQYFMFVIDPCLEIWS